MATSTIEKEVQKLDEEMAAAELHGDVTYLDDYLTDDFVGIGPRGFMLTKAEWLGRHRSGDLKYDVLDVTDRNVHAYGDAAIVTAHEVPRARYKGQISEGNYLTSHVFVRQDGQ